VAVDRVRRRADRDGPEHEHPEEHAVWDARMLDRLRQVHALRPSLRALLHGDTREGSAKMAASPACCGIVHLGRAVMPHVVSRTVAARRAAP
jgi:hypothetical protein